MAIVCPIETRYAGYVFRSRLEARWAVFFQKLSELTKNNYSEGGGALQWEYEPEGFSLSNGDWYLPDFRICYPGRWLEERHYVWFEVKPSIESISKAEWEKLLCFAESETLVLFDGVPERQIYFPVGRDEWSGGINSPIQRKSDTAGYLLWSSKGRLWVDPWSDDTYTSMVTEEQLIAIDAARAARF
jgi:hypothetical protein